MIRVYLVNNRCLELSWADWQNLKRAITTKEKFVELYDRDIEFINLDVITHIINTDEEY